MSGPVYQNYTNIVPTSSNFLRWSMHGAAVLGDRLFIDGGELAWVDGSGQRNTGVPSLTYSLPLDTAWDPRSISLTAYKKNGAPSLDNRCLWANATDRSISAFGGSLNFGIWYNQNVTRPQPAPTFWEFSASTNTWQQQYAVHGFPDVQPTAGTCSYALGTGYYLGGYLDDTTSPQGPEFAQSVPGLNEYTADDKYFSNDTATDLGYSQVYGQSQFISNFNSPDGLFAYFGGYSNFPSNTSVYTFDHLALWIPGTDEWYHQRTTGTIPSWRAGFCSVGVPGDDGTFEIFIYGGANDLTFHTIFGNADANAGGVWANSSQIESNRALDEVFVLSLPSFTWFKADYPASANRHMHTCHVVGSGSRQMLSFGGKDWADKNASNTYPSADASPLGIGLFDMTLMQWRDTYDPHLSHYTTPTVVKDSIAQNGSTPTTWDDPSLPSYFASTPTDPSPYARGPNVGAIVGGVVGGVVVIAFVAVGLWLFLRRRRRYQRTSSSDGDQDPPRYPTDPKYLAEDKSHQVIELGDTYKPIEMDGQYKPVEMDGQYREKRNELAVEQNPIELPADVVLQKESATRR